jgi:hypothetical protein
VASELEWSGSSGNLHRWRPWLESPGSQTEPWSQDCPGLDREQGTVLRLPHGSGLCPSGTFGTALTLFIFSYCGAGTGATLPVFEVLEEFYTFPQGWP